MIYQPNEWVAISFEEELGAVETFQGLYNNPADEVQHVLF